MKTAFILYGFLRTFDFCKQSLMDLVIDPLNADVFINTPNTYYTNPKDEKPEWHYFLSRNLDQVNEKSVDIFGDHLKELVIRDYDGQFYKDIAIEKNIPKIITFTDQHSFRVLSTMHAINMAVNTFKQYVEKHNLHYDLVILTRPDLKYYRTFNPQPVMMDKINYPTYTLLPYNHPEFIYLPHAVCKGLIPRIRTGAAGVHSDLTIVPRNFNDQIICGSQKNILLYSNYYESCFQYYDQGIMLNQETCLAIHLLKNNIDWTDSDFVLYEMWRVERNNL